MSEILACPLSRKSTKPKKNIQHSDPGKIMDLVMNLTDDSCSNLQVKINEYFTEECNAECCLMIVVNGERNEAFIEAVGNTALAKKVKVHLSEKQQEVLKMVNEISDLLSNFPPDFQTILSPHVSKENKKRILMLPVTGKPFSLIMCVVAPKQSEEYCTNVTHETFSFIWPTLKKSIAHEYECMLKNKCQQLLRVARRLFTEVATLETLLRIAKDQAKQLTKAEHCVVYLVDSERMELVEPGISPEGDSERRFPVDKGIMGLAVKSGQLINCKNPMQHPAYDPDIDSIPGVNCRNIMCFPIREQMGIIGVGELINKLGEDDFSGMDEEMALAFSIYCGVCITHSVIYKKIMEAHIRNALATELVMYHLEVSDDEVERMRSCTEFHGHPQLSSLNFNPRSLPVKELPCYVFRMFMDIGALKRFLIKPEKLCCFILHVKKGYRDVPYHTWLHAFNSAQWAYAAIIQFRLMKEGYISDLQALMYLISALVHDLDHRGTTSSFHISGQTTLAALYTSEGSVMERHHLAQAMCILNTEGSDILESLSRRDYDRALVMLKEFILATDLATFFNHLPEYTEIATDFIKGNRVHNKALMDLLMNAADLSEQLKDWDIVKKTAALVITEYFKQDDTVESTGDLPTMKIDRQHSYIPELQIQFLTSTCIPLFDKLGKIIPKAADCMEIIHEHMMKWEASKDVFAEVPANEGLSVLLSPELDGMIEESIALKERLAREAAEAEAEAAAAAAEAAAAAAAAEEDD